MKERVSQMYIWYGTTRDIHRPKLQARREELGISLGETGYETVSGGWSAKGLKISDNAPALLS